MWLLKFHIAASILCLLTFMGFKKVFKEQIAENGYTSNGKKNKAYWIFFIPILNVISVILLFVMIAIPEKDFNEWVEKNKKKKEEEKE